MNKFVGLFFALFFSSYASVSDCGKNFLLNLDKNYVYDMSLSGTINFYENAIAAAKRLKRKRTYVELNEVRSVYKSWFKNFKEFESHIFKGREDLAVLRLRKTFFNVDLALKRMDNYELIIKSIRNKDLSLTSVDDFSFSEELKKDIKSILSKNSNDKALKKFHSRLRREQRRLGAYFDKYSYFQKRINKLLSSAECKRNCSSTISKISKELGLNRSLDEISYIFKNAPSAIAVARKKEFLNESLSFFANIISRIDFTKSIFQALELKGIYQKSNLVKLFKSSYDTKARNLHRSIIDKISHASLTPKQRVDLIKRELVDYPDESFLVNFARSEDYFAKKAWNEIKDYSAKGRDLEFYSLITGSSDIARRLGRVGRFSLTKAIKRISIVVGLGVAVVYLMGDNDDIVAVEEDRDANSVGEEVEEETQVIKLKYGKEEEVNFFDVIKSIIDEIN